jgi:tetratricopeptide (TPR) repeat protein
MAVIDFGIAKSLDEPLSEHTLVTEAGAVVGTPEYMSPEQADGLPEAADVRSDVYALGTILYELLCRHRPIDRETLRRGGVGRVGETIRTTLVAPPSRRCRLDGRTDEAARIAGDLDAVCMKALAKDQADRYAGADAMLADLDRFLAGEPVLARAHSWRDNLRVAVRRHRTAVAVAASVALALAVGLASTVAFAIQAKRESEARRVQADRAATLADFLAGIFGQLDPEQARGRDTTLLRIMLDDAAEELLDNEHQLPNDVAAELHLVIGTAYKRLDALVEAELHLETAAAFFTGIDSGPRYLRQRIVALDELGALRYTQGRNEEAVGRANELMATLGWPQDPAVLENPRVLRKQAAFHMVGIVLDERGFELSPPQVPEDATEQAKQAIREAARDRVVADIRRLVATAEATLAPDHPDLLEILAFSGRALDLRGRREEAIELLEATLERADAVLGRTHPRTIEAVIYLSVAYRDRDPRNMELLEDRLPDVAVAYGPSHPRAANLEFNYAWGLHLAGRHDEAATRLRRSCTVFHDNFGPYHDMTIWADNSLLKALKAIDARAEAEAVLVARFEDWSKPEAPPIDEADLPVLLGWLDWYREWADRPVTLSAAAATHFDVHDRAAVVESDSDRRRESETISGAAAR